MSSDVSAFEGCIVKQDDLAKEDFWDESEPRIWVVTVDGDGKQTGHIRPIEGLEDIFHGKSDNNLQTMKQKLKLLLTGDDFAVAVDMLNNRRFPVKLEDGTFALPPMRPFKNAQGVLTVATADQTTGKYTCGHKNGSGTMTTTKFRPKAPPPPTAQNHGEMEVDLPLAFIHVFCDPNKLYGPDGLTIAKLEVAKLKFNEGLELPEDCTIFDDAEDLLLEDGTPSIFLFRY